MPANFLIQIFRKNFESYFVKLKSMIFLNFFFICYNSMIPEKLGILECLELSYSSIWMKSYGAIGAQIIPHPPYFFL